MSIIQTRWAYLCRCIITWGSGTWIYETVSEWDPITEDSKAKDIIANNIRGMQVEENIPQKIHQRFFFAKLIVVYIYFVLEKFMNVSRSRLLDVHFLPLQQYTYIKSPCIHIDFSIVIFYFLSSCSTCVQSILWNLPLQQLKVILTNTFYNNLDKFHATSQSKF